MNLPWILISQYLASLEMLCQTITRCPESMWDAANDKTKLWHIAYHVLFFTHLYLQESDRTFRPWAKHRKEYQFLAKILWPPYTLPRIGESYYDREDVLEYLVFCEQQVAEQVPPMDLEAASGFDWLPFSKLELQIYSIRHLQQHTDELMERLGTRADVEVDWVASKRG